MSKVVSRLTLTILTAVLLFACSKDERTAIQKIQQSGQLDVITRNSPTTYYQGIDGPAGIEYELITGFAEFLNVKVNWTFSENLEMMLTAIENNDAQIAAAGLTITPERQKQFKFSVPYQEITTQVVYQKGKQKPRKAEDLVGKKLLVSKNSSHEELLKTLQKTLPELQWASFEDAYLEQQFKRILNGDIDYLVADSHEISVQRRYYPEIRIGFDLSGTQQLAWLLPLNDDNSLTEQIEAFFIDLKARGELSRLLERYYGHVDRLNFVDKRTFFRHVEDRLPLYEDMFKQAAEQTGYDWRLLAAIAYQESHWNPTAKSPTGVRGLMMLTQATAKQMDVEDRLDPQQSIDGGARYLKRVESKIPERIDYPDRLWLALASYNIGYAHLEDARILTQRRKGNPDKWSDIKSNLPDLSNPKVYKTLKYGYARGEEPVNYVDNIRNYYDLMVWLDGDTEQPPSIFDSLPSFFDESHY